MSPCSHGFSWRFMKSSTADPALSGASRGSECVAPSQRPASAPGTSSSARRTAPGGSDRTALSPAIAAYTGTPREPSLGVGELRWEVAGGGIPLRSRVDHAGQGVVVIDGLVATDPRQGGVAPRLR